jgi:uncharacterized protein YbjT (DUF2867 family)
MTPGRVVVTGGSGFVGRAVCARLAADAAPPRVVVPTRQRGRAPQLWVLPRVEVVPCDVHDAAAMGRLLAGADALVHLVAILHGDAAAFERVHVALPRSLARACAAAGVRRVVHVSALGVAADAPSLYLRSKAAGEAVWRQSGLDVTILRPSVIFGAEDRFTNLFAAMQRALPLLPLAGAQARFQPVWVGDVAAAVLAALARPELAGQVIECAGPEVLTLRAIVARIGAMAGRARPVLPLPEGIGMAQAALLALLPGEPLLSRDNLRSMRVPNVASGKLPGLADLGLRPAALELLADHFAPRGR